MIVFFVTGYFLVFSQENQKSTVRYNWQGVELEQIIQYVSKVTNKTILYKPDMIKGKKVYLLSPTPIPTDALFKVLESILENNDLALVEVKIKGTTIYKLIQSTNVYNKPVPAYGYEEAQKLDLGESMVTEIIPLKYVDPDYVRTNLVNLTTGGRGILSIPGVNAVIVTDYALNVERIAQIIKLMDREKSVPIIKIIKLKHASVIDLEPNLSKVLSSLLEYEYAGPGGGEVPVGKAGKKGQIQIIPDKNSNSLIIVAPPETMQRIEEIIKKLDIPPAFIESQLQIYKLENADAEEIAKQLNEIYNQMYKEKTGVTAQGGKSVTEVTPYFVPIKQSNALVIMASPRDYKDIEKVVRSLDTRRPQVFIEAAIVEITAAEGFDIGAEITTIDNPASSARGFAGTLMGISQLVDTDKDGFPDAKIPIGPSVANAPAGAGFTAGIVKGSAGKIPFLLSALRRKAKVKVLSIPQVTTNDNEEAKINVSEQMPTTTTSIVGGTQTVTSFQNFQEAGTTLTIKPKIGEGDFLKLTIEQKIERFTGAPIASGVPPPKSTREIKTVVTVKDGNTVVLGGLVVDTEDKTNLQVPIIEKIPLIGNLFKRRQESLLKTQLFIFITPHIISTQKFPEYLRLTKKKYDDYLKSEIGDKFKIDFFDTGRPQALDFFEYKSPLK